MLNGTACALRPALTVADRARFLALAPASSDPVIGTLSTEPAQLMRADLIEDKVHGGVVGTVCVFGSKANPAAQVRLKSLSDRAPLRIAVGQLLRDDLPRLPANVAEPGIASNDGESREAFARALAVSLRIPDSYAADHALVWIDEPARLHYAGRDYVGRTLWLQHGAMQSWQAMQRAAAENGIALEAVSGFRSIGYQAGILRRKLDRGLSIDEVLAINTAPGYSEHHSGRALDIGTPGCPPAEEVFETTPAFAWLRQHAAQFGFRMSYPRDNRHGVIYEPWHWCFQT